MQNIQSEDQLNFSETNQNLGSLKEISLKTQTSLRQDQNPENSQNNTMIKSQQNLISLNSQRSEYKEGDSSREFNRQKNFSSELQDSSMSNSISYNVTSEQNFIETLNADQRIQQRVNVEQNEENRVLLSQPTLIQRVSALGSQYLLRMDPGLLPTVSATLEIQSRASMIPTIPENTEETLQRLSLSTTLQQIVRSERQYDLQSVHAQSLPGSSSQSRSTQQPSRNFSDAQQRNPTPNAPQPANHSVQAPVTQSLQFFTLNQTVLQLAQQLSKVSVQLQQQQQENERRNRLEAERLMRIERQNALLKEVNKQLLAKKKSHQKQLPKQSMHEGEQRTFRRMGQNHSQFFPNQENSSIGSIYNHPLSHVSRQFVQRDTLRGSAIEQKASSLGIQKAKQLDQTSDKRGNKKKANFTSAITVAKEKQSQEREEQEEEEQISNMTKTVNHFHGFKKNKRNEDKAEILLPTSWETIKVSVKGMFFGSKQNK